MGSSLKDEFKKLDISSKEFSRGDICITQNRGLRLNKDREDLREKTRPVVILHNNKGCADPLHELVLIAPITGNTKFIREWDYPLLAGEGNLSKDSIVLLGLIQPIKRIHLGRVIGTLDIGHMQQIDFRLLEILGMD